MIGTIVLWMSVIPSLGSAQQIQQIDGLAVFDANGKRVGPVMSIENRGNVRFSFEANNQLVTLEVAINGTTLFSLTNDTFSFESTDCSGPPLLRNQESLGQKVLWPSGRFVLGGPNPGQPGGGGDNILYWPDPNATELNGGGIVQIRSVSSPTELCTPTFGDSPHWKPIQAFLDIDTVFTRPFHV